MRHVPKALLALALAFGWQLTPVAAQPAQAVCGGSYCATLGLTLQASAGSGYAYSIPFGIDCTDETSGSVQCGYEFTLPGPGGMDVTIYLAPGTGSYGCSTSACGNLDQEFSFVVHLDPGNNKSTGATFNLAPHHMHLYVVLQGTGTGRVTSPPLGLDCRITAGVVSGTCSKEVYWINDTPVYSLVVDPADTSYLCFAETCHPPGDGLTIPSLNGTDGDAGSVFKIYAKKSTKVSITGTGSVKSTPSGISCPSTCSAFFIPDTAPGETTSFKATPASGWKFKSWGGACAGVTGTTCAIAIGTNGASISATFVSLATPAPSTAPTPKPTSKPTAAPTGAPASDPPASAEPAAGSAPPSFEPTLEPTDEPSTAPNASPVPAGTPDPTDPSAPVVEPGAGATIDPLVLGLIAIIALLLLSLGFLLGQRRRPRAAT